MSPVDARKWRTLGALAIWLGVLGAIVLMVFVVLSGFGELGSYDCGTACQERQAAAEVRRHWMTWLALGGGGALVIGGIVIRLGVPNPDD
jgi:hypothetical protein